MSELPVIPGQRSAECPFDPPAEYAKWRTAEGLRRARLRDGSTVWAVSRYEDIRAALRDSRLSAAVNMPSNGFPERDVPPLLVRMDDPPHAAVRRLLNSEFTVRRVQALHPMIQDAADDRLTEMIMSCPGRGDLVGGYALPVSFTVICQLLGIPPQDVAFFCARSEPVHDSTVTAHDKQTASWALLEYLLDLIERRVRDPGDDLLSRLTGHIATGELTAMDVAMSGLALLVAGHDPTANMIALGTLVLLCHPDQLARVRDTDDPAELAAAVEELLRYLTIVHDDITRVATEDLTIGGERVRAGDWVAMNLPAGNWDPDFVDRPDEFDIGRGARGHLAFGFGVHQCVGQNLARAELRIALPTLLRRLPDLRLDGRLEQVEFRHSMSTYGVERLPVTW